MILFVLRQKSILSLMLCIYLLCLMVSARGDTIWEEKKKFTSPGNFKFKLPAYELEDLSFQVTNIGESLVKNIWISNIKDPDFTSVDALLLSILKGKKTAKEKAMAIYELIKDYRYHFYPPTEGDEEHDPILWLNVYGYGFCDDAATAATFLWERAGMKSRIWWLSGHVVPEVFYHNDWHLFDPDEEIIFCEKNSSRIASVEYLIKHPDIIDNTWIKKRGTAWPNYKEFFITTENNRISYARRGREGYSPRWTLRPGESFIRFKTRRLAPPVVNRSYNRVPPHYSNGEWIFELPVSNISQLSDIVIKGLKANDGKDLVLRLDDNATTGELLFSVQCGFVFVDGRLYVKGQLDAPKDRIHIYISKDKNEWREVLFLQGPDVAPAETNLSRFAFHTYKLYFKIVFSRASLITSPSLESLTVRLITQCNPFTFPLLEMGKKNTWLIEFNIDQEKDRKPLV